MPVITSIKPQKNKKRVNIYLDGKFGFGLDLENFVKLRLKTEQELSNEQINEIVTRAEFAKSYERLLKFSMLRPRSEKELEDWMKRKKIYSGTCKLLLEKIKHLELVDDRKFSKWWVEQRIQFKHKSRRDLEYELKLKGIESEVIKETLNNFEVDDNKTAKELINRYSYKWNKFDERIAREKKAQFLARKGFDWDVIKKVTG